MARTKRLSGDVVGRMLARRNEVWSKQAALALLEAVIVAVSQLEQLPREEWLGQERDIRRRLAVLFLDLDDLIEERGWG